MYNIKASKTVPGMFEAVASDGSVFNNGKGKVAYKSEGGLRAALTRMGQVYVEVEKPQAEKVEKVAKTFADSQAHKMGFTEETCINIYNWILNERRTGNVDNFAQLAEKLSIQIKSKITSKQFNACFRSGQAAHLKATKPEREAKEAAKAAEKAAKALEPKTETVESTWNAEAANAVAKLHGFTNGYRGVRRAARSPENPRHAEALALKSLCVAAGHGKSLAQHIAKVEPKAMPKATNEAELFAALKGLKVA